jgi:hypothetical protein
VKFAAAVEPTTVNLAATGESPKADVVPSDD